MEHDEKKSIEGSSLIIRYMYITSDEFYTVASRTP